MVAAGDASAGTAGLDSSELPSTNESNSSVGDNDGSSVRIAVGGGGGRIPIVPLAVHPPGRPRTYLPQPVSGIASALTGPFGPNFCRRFWFRLRLFRALFCLEGREGRIGCEDAAPIGAGAEEDEAAVAARRRGNGEPDEDETERPRFS